MQYCAQCVLPNTKPGLTFDEEGVCSACRAHELKNRLQDGIDWNDRQALFRGIVAGTKARGARRYDILVPVSGGKDSITQVARVVELDLDLRLLAVTVDYGIKTDIGRRNLECIPRMGADLITWRPDQRLHRSLIRLGFEDFGDPDLLSHALLHAAPLHLAMEFKVPLVLNGENSAFEYGGPETVAASDGMTAAWFRDYAFHSGADIGSISEKYDIPIERLSMYDYPASFDASNVRSVFMSHFYHWESEAHLEVAQKYGFERLGSPAEGTYRDYVGIDETVVHRIHQYFKVLKFGYGRATDHACEDIRNGRISREAGARLVAEHDLLPLGDWCVQPFCETYGYTREEFELVLERYRNRKIWKRECTGDWVLEGHLSEQLQG